MKYLFSFLLLYVYTSAIGQSYTPFPTAGAIWMDYSWSGYNSPGLLTTSANDFEYYIQGDTVVVNTYSKLFRVGFNYSNTTSAESYTYDSTFYPCAYYGGLRSDSLKHVYFLPKGSNNEQLLYDFNLSVGDTLPLTYNYFTYNFNVNIVKSIDSVFIDSSYRKRYNICPTNNTNNQFVSLVEGVGSTNGLFNNLIIQPTPLYGGNLICFYMDSLSVFNPNPSYTAGQSYRGCNLYPCVLISNINELQNPNINIYPCPVKNKLIIECSRVQKECTLIIFNLNGLELMRQQIKDYKKQIDISNLASGVYFVKLITDKTSEVRKIIKE